MVATVTKSGGSGGGRGRRSRRGSAPMSEINVTPFVDVMLVLLIIFMVSAPLLTPGVGVDLPRVNEARTLSRPSTPPVPVALAADGRLYYGKDPVSFEELTARLAQARAEGGSDRVYLRAAATIEYQRVAELIVALANAGYANIGFITSDKAAAAGRLAPGGETVDLDRRAPAGAEGADAPSDASSDPSSTGAPAPAPGE